MNLFRCQANLVVRCARVLVLAGIVVVMAGCAVRYRYSDFMRAAPGAPVDAAAAAADLPAGYQVQASFVDTSDGERLYRVAFTHPGARSDLLFFPGNGFRSDRQAAAYAKSLLAIWRVNLVLYDYRGRGQSTGTGTVMNSRADALLTFDTEQKQADQAGRKLVVGGFSLGGISAAAAAEERRPAAVLLLATTTDAQEHADAVLPWYAKAFFRLDIAPDVASVDTRRAVKAYTGPLFVAVGGDDRSAPPILSERLFAASASPADRRQLIVAPGVAHNDLLQAPAIKAALQSFVKANDL